MMYNYNTKVVSNNDKFDASEEFRSKYQGNERDLYTNQQLVSANEVLEFLYEENVGATIVSGKNQNPERNIPPIQT